MNASNRAVYTVAAVVMACTILWPASAARAQAAHEHAHAASGAAVTQVQLDDGRKWPTDASLRAGMAEIRKAFDADHPAIHAGKETDKQYDALAARVTTAVDGIVANCRLPPAADANLHYLIADLMQGASLMRGQDPARSRHDGAALVHGALLAYGKYFDDPGWTP
jgi:hypothetical protein